MQGCWLPESNRGSHDQNSRHEVPFLICCDGGGGHVFCDALLLALLALPFEEAAAPSVTCVEEKASSTGKHMASAIAAEPAASADKWYPPLEARMRQFIPAMDALFGQGGWCFTGSAAVAFLAHQFGNAFGEMAEPGDIDMLVHGPIRHVATLSIRAGDEVYTYQKGTESSATFAAAAAALSGRTIDISRSRISLRVALFDGSVPINHDLLGEYAFAERNQNAPKVAVLRRIKALFDAYIEAHPDRLYVDGSNKPRSGRARGAIGLRMNFGNDSNSNGNSSNKGPRTLFGGHENDDVSDGRASKRRRLEYGGSRHQKRRSRKQKQKQKRRHRPSGTSRGFGGKSRRFSLRAK
jgi:hypothetical protein